MKNRLTQSGRDSKSLIQWVAVATHQIKVAVLSDLILETQAR
jgi:hypothetical protein